MLLPIATAVPIQATTRDQLIIQGHRILIDDPEARAVMATPTIQETRLACDAARQTMAKVQVVVASTA